MEYTEQRQFERYFPPEGAIAMLKPFKEFGVISDISKGGMAFEYLAIIESNGGSPEIGPQREIEIFIPKCDSRPMTIPCKVVRVEKRLLGTYTHSVIPKKRCSVEFMGFEKDTKKAFDAFIAQCRECKSTLG